MLQRKEEEVIRSFGAVCRITPTVGPSNWHFAYQFHPNALNDMKFARFVAQTVLTDGIDVQVIARDKSADGQWDKERIYPRQSSSSTTSMGNLGSRRTRCLRRTSHLQQEVDLRAKIYNSICRTQQEFADKFLAGKIMFESEILSVCRDEVNSSWILSIRKPSTGASATHHFSKIVLCTEVSYRSRYEHNI
jgi:hypothetical protein